MSSAKEHSERGALRNHGPVFFLLAGGCLAFVSAGAAFGLWLNISGDSVTSTTSALDGVASLAGVDVKTAESSPTPLWMMLAFVLSLAACGFGLFVAVVGTIWATSRGARRAATTVTAPETSANVKRGLIASKEKAKSGTASASTSLLRSASAMRERIRGGSGEGTE